MTTSPSEMTITEFLLARITEDEVKATLRTVHAEDCGWIPNEAGYSYPCNCGVPERMAAECAAKRAIIERQVTIWEMAQGATLNDAEDEENEGLAYAIRALASIYADHPDYQQEWAL